MKRLIAVAALCVIAGPAAAQTTTCNSSGNQMTGQQNQGIQQNPGAVAKAIAEGRCDEAKKMALEWGDLDLAQQAVSLCTPAP